MKTTLSTLVILFCYALSLSASAPVPVYSIKIHKEISPTTTIYLQKGLEEAKLMQAEAVILDMNTYGGTVVDADSMRTAILRSSIPVYTFINNNAASAGALIAIASKKIFMVKGAAIGAATVVEQTGEAAPDKYQSYMRGIIKSTAESHGKDTLIVNNDTTILWKRDPKIAEAMVDSRVFIPHINDSGRVITFTADEALTHRYCDAIVSDIDDIIRNQLHIEEYTLRSYQPTWFENTKGFLLNPMLQAFLIMIIIAGIYFELQTPGVGFPSLLALGAALLYFTPLWIDGVAQYWEIILFFVGVILLVVEIFVIPGFGVAGVLGIIFSITGLTLALIDADAFSFNPSQPLQVSGLTKPLLTVLVGLFMGVGASILLATRIGKKGIFQTIALSKNIDSTIISDEERHSLLGKIGIAETVLRPSGKISIEGEFYDAVSQKGVFIEKGAQIKVLKQEAAQLYVIQIVN